MAGSTASAARRNGFFVERGPVQFNDYPLSEPLLRAVRDEGFQAPTALQRSAIPAILGGRDVLAVAQTGTGKTAAYALGVLERLSAEPADHPRALVMAATREVALQILETFETLGRNTAVRVVALVDNPPSYAAQTEALREGRDVLIAMPGRLLDLIDLGLAQLGQIEICVLDEVEDLDKLGQLPVAVRAAGFIAAHPQTLILTAHLTDTIKAMADELLDHPVELEAAPHALTVTHVDQRVIFTPRGSKSALLKHLLADPAMSRVLIYLRSRRAAQKLQRQLKSAGIDCELGRPARVQIVTDGAARRVRLNDLTHIINYDVPGEVEVYVHRVGRSVRAGSTAQAITLCDEEERAALGEIETTIHMKLTVIDNPLPAQPPEATPAGDARSAHVSVAREPRREERAPREERPARDSGREERPPRRDEPRSGGRPDREPRGRFFEDETPPAAIINFVSAPHPQVKKTIDEWFTEREEKSPLEDAAVAAYLAEHPELVPQKAVRNPPRRGNEPRRERSAESRDGQASRGERQGDSNRKRRRVRGGQRRGGRRGSTNGAPPPSAGA